MRTRFTLKPFARERKDERGAALISVLLLSLLLLTAGGILILTTSMTGTNAVNATAETQAYYAAEAGLQATLDVLRGNVAPNPLFNTSSPTAPENQISFRKAVTQSTSNLSGDTSAPRLSRWLSYDSTYTDRVTINSNYSPVNGMAFSTTVSDPDNLAGTTFYTQGAFDNNAPANTAAKSYGGGNSKVTVTFNQQTSTTINGSGSSTLGSFTINGLGPSSYTIPANETFRLVIVQTAPQPVTTTINCTLSGTISNSSGQLTITFPITSPANTNNLQGVLYTLTAASFNLPKGTTSIPVAISAPEPTRLLVRVTGFGPRGARKMMQMLVSSFTLSYTPSAAITIRSADDGTVLNFNSGNSAVYGYSGFDNAGAQSLPAFAVTSTPDYNYLIGLGLPAGQVTGSPSGIQQVAVSSLVSWLQTADNARAFVDSLRTEAMNQNRYFTTSSPPSNFGASASNGRLTFVDGDVSIPPAGGKGLLIVTGTLTANGNPPFDGIILVLGTGQFIRSGGGNGTTLGSIAVARFGASGNFLAPTFNSNGSGTSQITYDSAWAQRGSQSGPYVLGVSEY